MISRKFLVLLFFFIVTVIIFICAVLSIATNKVQMEKHPRESHIHKEVGPLYPKQQFRCIFNLTNPFNENLKITEISRNCGCLRTKIGTDQIAPHESTPIELTLKSPRKAGKYNLQVLVLSETKKTKTQYQSLFHIQTQTASVIEVQDSFPFIQLGQFQLNEIPVKKTLIITKGNHPLQWDTLKCQSDNDNVKATLIRINPQKWHLVLCVENIFSIGEIHGNLKFSFWRSGEQQTYFLIHPVQISIVGPILPIPKSILIGAVQEGQSAEKTVRLIPTKNDSRSIKILSVSSTGGQEVKAKIIREKEEDIVSVVFTASKKKGLHQGLIVINVKLDETYQVHVKYLAHVL